MLGVSLVAIKAYHLGVPPRDGLFDYVRSILAISYVDVLFATVCWAAARLLLVIASRRPIAARAVSGAFVGFAAVCCLYAVVNIILFGVVGGFLTYPLLAVIGDVRMVRSSVGACKRYRRRDGSVRVRRSSQQRGLRRAITRM